jgi:IclR family transcriptional regulator, blcABC operon repressor
MLQLDPVEPIEKAPRRRGPASAALVPAVTRALAVLDLLEKERTAMTMARLAERLALPKSSVHGLCNTLIALGYLRRYHDGGCFIGPRVMGLAHAFTARTTPASEFDALWAELPSPPQETTVLSVLDGNEVVYVAVRPGARPLGLAFSVGMRLPAERTATGKAMLSQQSEARIRQQWPGARLPAFMTRPARRRSELLAELAQARLDGFAVDDEGIREGVFCVGAPVLDANAQVVAGVGVCVSKATVSEASWPQLRDAVRRVASDLSRRLGADPSFEPAPLPDPAPEVRR